MNTKFMKKIIGRLYHEEIDWNDEIIQYKEKVIHEASLPIPIDKVPLLLKEMTEQQKRLMISILSLSIDRSGRKKFPEILFLKEVNTVLRQCKRENIDYKMKLILAVLQIVSPVLENEEDLQGFVTKQEEFIQEFGPWHFYWAFYFHPEKEISTTLWQEKHTQLLEQLNNLEMESSEDLIENEPVKQIKKESIDEKNTKIMLLEKKIETEIKRRQDKELELKQQKKDWFQSEKHIQQLIEKNKHLEEEVNKWHRKNEELIEQGIVDKKSWTKRNQDLIQDNKRLQQQLEKIEIKWAETVQDLEQMTKQTENRKVEITQLKIELQDALQKQRDKQSIPTLIHDLVQMVYQELDRNNQLLLEDKSVRSSAKELREQMKQALTFIDYIEEYKINTYLSKQSLDIETSDKIEAVENKMEEIIEVDEEDKEDEEDKPSGNEQQVYSGIFFRRDHGGFIQLENGEGFNITETIVYEHSLQHEAEVECTPIEEKNGVMYYDIKLLFQGDDDYSPIDQYDGYIEIGDHYTLYCVDMNNSDNRFLLHEKDNMFLKPEDGTPCTFNVNIGSDMARISRIHKVFNERNKMTNQQNTYPNRKNRRTDRPKEKPTPFLEGCRIAVIGGQRKRFEEVVHETGAELIHDDGHTPERIYAELRKANALFLLLTSNSHRATWGCIEIAKENQIPHFVIQGSKSNVRNLLWDNRDMIHDSCHSM